MLIQQSHHGYPISSGEKCSKQKEPHSLQGTAKGLDLVWRSMKAFLRKIEPKDKPESARDRAGVEKRGNITGPGNSLCKCPAVGWSMVHSGSGKAVHEAEEEGRGRKRMLGSQGPAHMVSYAGPNCSALSPPALPSTHHAQKVHLLEEQGQEWGHGGQAPRACLLQLPRPLPLLSEKQFISRPLPKSIERHPETL